jgi:hypothetical protein
MTYYSVHNYVDNEKQIPPPLPLPSGPASGSESTPARREALLGRRQKGVPPFAGFGKEGRGEIFKIICLVNYGLLGNYQMSKVRL